MSRPKGRPKRLPIVRLGWRSALAGIQAGELRLSKRENGSDELLGGAEFRYALFYLTRASVRRLEAALASPGN